MDTNQYETRAKIDEPILKMYKYGSKVYGCTTKNSDDDWIVVVQSNKDLYYSVTINDDNYTVYSESMFIKRIDEHHISIMECIFQDENDPYLKYFKLDLSKLRHAISSVASNSYGKCRKKIAQGDIYIGKKSLFHSLRILNFGIQIAIYGKIIDYSSANIFHKTIFELPDDWKILDEKLKPIYNHLKSYFKVVAPIEKK